MRSVKRIQGDLLYESLAKSDYIPVNPLDPDNTNPDLHSIKIRTNELLIDGDLRVSGTTITEHKEEVAIGDANLILNNGQIGSGIGGSLTVEGTDSAGISIDRGNFVSTEIRYNDAIDWWEATDDGVEYYPLNPVNNPAFDFRLVTDPGPHLGGNLIINYQDTNLDYTDFKISSTHSQDVVIDADGTGQVKLDHVLSLETQATIPDAETGYTKIYAGPVGLGGTGFHVKNDEIEDELVSRKKAILLGLIL